MLTKPPTPKKARKHTQFTRNPKTNSRKNSISTLASMNDLAVFPIPKSPNISLVSLNCNEENPIMFAINPRKFDGKNLQKMTSKKFINFLSVQKNINKSKRGLLNNDSRNLSITGILRWDDKTFKNKSQVQSQEFEFLQKKIQSEDSLNFIRQYSLKFAEDNDAGKIKYIDKQPNSQRRDAFGNLIEKGGTQHRVSFAFHGKMDLARKWEKLGMNASGPSQSEIKLLKNTSERLIESHQKKDDKKHTKKRCRLF